MFGTLFMSKKKKAELAAQKKEQEYKHSCDERDRQRWARVSREQLDRLESAMSAVYRRAGTQFDRMKRPYGVMKFHFENLSGPGEIRAAWTKDYYSFKKAGFGTHDPRMERRMYAELRLSYEFYRGNMDPDAKAALSDVIQIVDEYIENLCCMDVEDAAEVFQQRYY